MTPANPNPEVETVPGWAIRLEAKVDVALARLADQAERHGGDLDDHETRLRALESTPNVTPKGLAATLALTVTALGGFVAFIDRLTGVG